MNSITPRRPSGFNEYLPGEQIEFNRLLDIVRGVYESYGFSPIDTPDLELTEVLLAKGGGETEKQVYSFKREGSDTDLTLRYDLTIPLARYVAEHQSDITFPFYRYHIGKVHRAERAQAGRFREFYQCDIDIVGSKSPVVDAQFPAIINDIFERFNFGEFTIRISNRLVFDGFFESLGLKDKFTDILHIIDKIEKISKDALSTELAAAGLNEDQTATVLAFTDIEGSNDEVLGKLRSLNVETPAFVDGVERLQVLIDALRAMNIPESRFQIDLKIVRGLDYYTGTVYETKLNDYPQVGSVCSGGRYDNLAGYYTKTDLPGVGISIGLSRLFYALRQIGVISTRRQSPARVIVLPLGAEQLAYGIEVASHLRSQGVSTMLNTEPGDLGKRLKYTDRTGFPYAVVIGAEEAGTRSVSLKDMINGKSQSVPLDDLVRYIEA